MNKLQTIWTGLLLSMLLIGCGGENTSSNVSAPGEDKTTESKILGIGADIIQDKTPLAY